MQPPLASSKQLHTSRTKRDARQTETMPNRHPFRPRLRLGQQHAPGCTGTLSLQGYRNKPKSMHGQTKLNYAATEWLSTPPLSNQPPSASPTKAITHVSLCHKIPQAQNIARRCAIADSRPSGQRRASIPPFRRASFASRAQSRNAREVAAQMPETTLLKNAMPC